MLMRKHMNPTQSEIRSYVESLRKECNEFIAASYGVKVEPKNIRLSFSSRRRRSWGGQGRHGMHISLALSSYLRGSTMFSEYSFIEADPVIGTVRSESWHEPVRALYLHEVAHAIEHAVKPVLSASALKTDIRTVMTGREPRGHGMPWRTIYRNLRSNCPYPSKIMENTETLVMTATPETKAPAGKRDNGDLVRAFIRENREKVARKDLVRLLQKEFVMTYANAHYFVNRAKV